MSNHAPGTRLLAGALFLILLVLPHRVLACACGCGIFQVGTTGMLPTTMQSGTTIYARFDELDQSKDWFGDSSAPANANSDRHIRTLFQTFGLQTLFGRNWGLRVEVPYWQRHFTTAGDADQLASYDHGALGDIRVTGSYTGFSPDRSTGLLFGLKLATGDWTYAHFDRDTEIGTGTTDLLLGGYHQWRFGANAGWGGFAQGMVDLPTAGRAGYRPGNELDAALGVYPVGWNLAPRIHLTPILQALVSLRDHDRGSAADPANSGYQRVLASPALELQWSRLRVDASIAAPLYQHVRGHQLVAPWQSSLTISYML
ncbi:hypothetical protein [Dyella sp. A6]|uniref:hypothetical protein n=1 Tax=Dyella aluminiiresistens TaxID=3069105 RepID=UPI002E79DC5B|nr:hypothetical protein [Dyella sp. A6]